MSESKIAARAEVRARARQNGGPDPRGETLALRVERLDVFAAARTVALYAAMPDEAPTAAMLARWTDVKRLALPVIVRGGTPDDRGGEGTDSVGGGSTSVAAGGSAGGGVMVFREYRGPADLSTGVFGIASPAQGAVVPPEEIDLMLVPGVAFDAAGGRLGRGGGFYDRYLSAPATARIYKVGLCPPRALVAEVPTEPHDVKMDAVLVAD